MRLAPLAIPTTTTGVDPVTGLAIEAFDASPAFTSVTPPGGTGTYLRGDSGVQVSHLRPIQPKLVVELTGTQGHGALVTGLTSSDDARVESGVRAPDRRPDRRRAGARVQRRRLPLEAPDGAHATSSPRASASGSSSERASSSATRPRSTRTARGIQRRYTRIAGHVYRSTSTDRLAPTFTKIDAFLVTGNAAFSVETAGRRRAARARRVPLRHRASGSSSTSRRARAGAGAGGGPVGGTTVRVLRPGGRRGGQRRRQHEQGLLLRRRRASARPDPERAARARTARAERRQRVVHGLCRRLGRRPRGRACAGERRRWPVRRTRGRTGRSR